MMGHESIAQCMRHTSRDLKGAHNGLMHRMESLEDQMRRNCRDYKAAAKTCWQAQADYFKILRNGQQDIRDNNAKIEQKIHAGERLNTRLRHDYNSAKREKGQDGPEF